MYLVNILQSSILLPTMNFLMMNPCNFHSNFQHDLTSYSVFDDSGLLTDLINAGFWSLKEKSVSKPHN
jgi:hypothetical protein